MMDRLIVVFAVCVVSVSATFNFTLNDCLGKIISEFTLVIVKNRIYTLLLSYNQKI